MTSPATMRLVGLLVIVVSCLAQSGCAGQDRGPCPRCEATKPTPTAVRTFYFDESPFLDALWVSLQPDGVFHAANEDRTSRMGPFGPDHWTGSWVAQGKRLTLTIESAWHLPRQVFPCPEPRIVHATLVNHRLHILDIPGRPFGQGLTLCER